MAAGRREAVAVRVAAADIRLAAAMIPSTATMIVSTPTRTTSIPNMTLIPARTMLMARRVRDTVADVQRPAQSGAVVAIPSRIGCSRSTEFPFGCITGGRIVLIVDGRSILLI
jgi:hypothetical protein